ncbi:hypothetical protein [Alloscardovia omnicolens]|uniref:hypothetical protein n=1 Tax=Alloscardovia omnicolens TaxID=419015 RepID=UPI003A6AF90D
MKNCTRMMMRTLTSLLCIAIVIPIAGCFPSTSSQFKEIQLEQYIAALPIYDAGKIPGQHSYVALLDPKGQAKILTINTMFYNQPVWTQAGMHFVDNKRNYFMAFDSSHTRVSDYAKTEFQYGSTFYDDNTLVTMLNKGLDKTKDAAIAISKSDGSYKEFAYSTEAAHTLSNLSTCNQSTYTIDLSRDIENPELVISKVFDGKTPQYTVEDKVRADVNAFDEQLQTLFEGHPTVTNRNNLGTAFCQNGKLSTFVTVTATQTESRVGSVMLFQWDTSTKESHFIPLKDEKTGGYITTTQATTWGEYSTDERAASENEALVMSDLSGEILAVNTNTGVARQFAPKIIEHNDQFETDFYGRMVMRTTKDYVFAFALYENDKSGTKSFINVYSRKDGSLLTTIHVDKAVNSKVYAKSFKFGYPAVNPRYKWS